MYKQLDAEVLGEGKLFYFYGLLDAEGDMMGEGRHCTIIPESEAKFCVYIAIHTEQMAMPLICIGWVPSTNLDQNTNYAQDFVILLRPSSQIPGYYLILSCNYFLPYSSELTM